MSTKEIDLDFESNCPTCFGKGFLLYRNEVGLTQTPCKNKSCDKGKVHLKDLELEDDSPTYEGDRG